MEIAEFQDLIQRIYAERDGPRGIPKNYLRFVEEVGELAEAFFYDRKEELPGEFADVFAWLVSMASCAGVQLEDAIAKYADGCPGCHAIPCACD